MNVTVTGGAGFIGRWISKRLLEYNQVKVIDDFSNSSMDNISGLKYSDNLKLYNNSILDPSALSESLKDSDLCIHLAAKINVQDSLDNPIEHVDHNYIGTFRLLEECRKKDIRLIIFGTCMVYDLSKGEPISETHPVLPKSPYAATKLAAEELALSYVHGYNLPVSVVRVFNTYGPFQKSNSEGGVVSIFIKNYLQGNKINIFGSGEQTRDLLYVEDCAEFIEKVIENAPFKGEVYNAGSGEDVSINELAKQICPEESMIKHVPHIHPQSEIMKLICDYSKAKKELGWMPKTSLCEGLDKTVDWMRGRM